MYILYFCEIECFTLKNEIGNLSLEKCIRYFFVKIKPLNFRPMKCFLLFMQENEIYAP